jgi:hypothetical protein
VIAIKLKAEFNEPERSKLDDAGSAQTAEGRPVMCWRDTSVANTIAGDFPTLQVSSTLIEMYFIPTLFLIRSSKCALDLRRDDG